MIQQVYVVPDKAVVRQRGLKLVQEILLPGINAVRPLLNNKSLYICQIACNFTAGGRRYESR